MRVLAFSLFSMFLVVQLSPVFGQEPTAKPDEDNVFVEMQIVTIPEKIAATFPADLRDEGKIDSTWEKIQALISDGSAKLVGWPTLTTQNKQKAVFEAVNEVRYPTAYIRAPVETYYAEDKEEANFVTHLTEEKGLFTETEFDAVPSAFETKEVGTKLEVEPTISEGGQTIQLKITPQDLHQSSPVKVALAEKENDVLVPKGDVVVTRPQFESTGEATSIVIRNGARKLLGVSRQADQLELFILRAEIQRVK